MNLNLPTLRARGRPALPLTAVVVRELTAEDIEASQQSKGSKAPALKRLTDRHHAVARGIASGMQMQEVSAVLGISQSRISILKDDPAFKELVEFYREKTDAQYADMHARLAGMSAAAVAEIEDRLEDRPDKIGLASLIEIAKMGADRTGHGPQSKNTNVNINFNLADRLEAARKRVAARTIEASDAPD